ncbi:unnamed protein product [Polarella glacialis]|uniref:C2H2-type domain-containing protein n=1 Tax=Polarella glacialis TaxID=89957 RepID=A0A813HU83_POLGL|nr:unnamed protein product [Polarella glacialis]
MRQHQPSFAFTSIQVNYGFASREHVDLNNEGPSWIHALGDYEGGELWVEDPAARDEAPHVCGVDVRRGNGALAYRKAVAYHGRNLDVRRQWQHFDGRKLHFTRPILRGKRFSVISYTLLRHGKAEAAQRDAATACGFNLPPPPPAVCSKHRREAKSHQCSACDKCFSTSSRLYRHSRSHNAASHICSFPGCARAFRREENLRRHASSHCGDKPHRCDFPGCEKSFAYQTGLKRHARLHGDSAAAKRQGSAATAPAAKRPTKTTTTTPTTITPTTTAVAAAPEQQRRCRSSGLPPVGLPSEQKAEPPCATKVRRVSAEMRTRRDIARSDMEDADHVKGKRKLTA